VAEMPLEVVGHKDGRCQVCSTAGHAASESNQGEPAVAMSIEAHEALFAPLRQMVPVQGTHYAEKL